MFNIVGVSFFYEKVHVEQLCSTVLEVEFAQMHTKLRKFCVDFET